MMVCRRLPTFRFELLFPYLFLFVGTSIDGVDPWSRRTPVWTYAFTHYKVQGLGVSYLPGHMRLCASGWNFLSEEFRYIIDPVRRT